jgi:hypothetical protein
MNKLSYYKQFLSFSNDRLFYMHMIVVAFLVAELRPTGTGGLYYSVYILALASMIYGLVKTSSYEGHITKLKTELTTNGLWRENQQRKEGLYSFMQFLKRFPLLEPFYAQSVIGISLFFYYLYITKAFPESFLSNVSGWILFAGIYLLSITLLVFQASLFYASSSPQKTQLLKSYNFLRPITFLLNFIGQLPIAVVIIHLLARLVFEPGVHVGYKFFPSEHHWFILYYLSILSGALMQRLTFRSVLHEERNEEENANEE